jgi:hypothetical protein
MGTVTVQERPHGWRCLIGATGLTLLSFAVLAATVATTATGKDASRGVAVVFAPWTPSEGALGRSVGAGARFVRFGAAPFVTIVVPESEGYAARAFAAGAWLVIDPLALSACIPFFKTEAPPA